MGKHIIGKQLTAFEGYLRAEEREPGTIEKYLRDVRAFAAWLDGRALDKETAIAWKGHLIGMGYAPSTINSMLIAVNRFFRFQRWEDLRVKTMRIQRRIFRSRDRELTKEEYVRLIETARAQGKERLALLMETICATGIRVSEVRYITVEAARAGRVEVTNKGKARTVFLPARLQKVLLRYARGRGIAAGIIFVTRSGRPLDRSNIWRSMKGLCREARVAENKVFPHNLRHLFARTYYALEKDIVRLADILGHASVNTTRIYTAESGRTHRRQLEKMRLVL